MTKQSDTLNTIEPITCNQYMEIVKKITSEITTDGKMNLQGVSKVAQEAMIFSAYWNVQYLFSPAVSPNTNAKKEHEQYEILIDNLINSIAEKVPETREHLVAQKELTEIKYIAEWNIDYYKYKPIQKLSKDLLATIASILKAIGFKNIAKSLTIKQLFPSWTIARNE